MIRLWICLLLSLLNLTTVHASSLMTNPLRTDGFGAQFQSLIYAAVYAEFSGKEFVYTPFSAMEHNYDSDPEFLSKKEKLINFIGNFPLNTDPTLQEAAHNRYYAFFESHLGECSRSLTLKKIKKLFRGNKQKEEYFAPGRFHIAVHIRRPNIHDNRIQGADTPDVFYLKAIRQLRKTYAAQNPLFHIFSQGDLSIFQRIYKGEDIVFHLSDSVEESFPAMVFADALVTSGSSYSYVAALLSEGAIYYTPFWHPPLPGWNILKCQ